MTARSDITVRWDLSPRVIVVQAPSAEVTIQDLHDTCRNLEDEPDTMIYPSLISTAGKEPLGGGVTVGLTSTLQNAQLAFEARPEATEEGTVTTTDATGLTLIDSAATFIANGVVGGATVFNCTTGDTGSVVSVDSETQLTLFEPLQGGGGGGFTFGDVHRVHNEIQCNVSGGNLVAVDDVDAELDPIYPTAFTQVVRTSSSSATIANQSTLEHAAFDQAVWIDVDNGTAGTVYPIGTPETPSDNLMDAVTIAGVRGFKDVKLLSDLTISAGDDLTGFNLIGRGGTFTTITLGGGSVDDARIEKATVAGAGSTGMVMFECIVGAVTGFQGVLRESFLVGPITLVAGGGNTTIANCGSVLDAGGGTNVVTIDMGGTGNRLRVSPWLGDMNITNKTDAGESEIDITAGEVTLDATLTGGTFEFHGTGTVNDNSVGATVEVDEIVQPYMVEEIHSSMLGRLLIDEATKTMTIYKPDNTTQVATYNLFDRLGVASVEEIFERFRT